METREKIVEIVKRIVLIIAILIVIGWFTNSQKSPGGSPSPVPGTPAAAPTASNPSPSPTAGNPNACNVAKLSKSAVQGLKVYSPGGDRYIINKEDDKGVGQIYVGTTGSAQLTCITCTQAAGGPKPDRFKMQPHWHPSGRWITMAVERDSYKTPPVLGLNRDYVEGQLQNGLWTNMWAVSPEGKNWTRLTDFRSESGYADGYTGPAFTADGRKLVWSQAVDGNILSYWPFGRWELTMADFTESGGVPKLSNLKNITPANMYWNEPGNFAPDGVSILLSGSTEKDAEGMDQYILNVLTGKLTDLTNSPKVWDEHGIFSPSGQKVLFMSAYPYRDSADASKITSIKTEFMLMNRDGSNLTQLTHFRTDGYPESSKGIAANGEWSLDGTSVNLRQLVFPNYVDWTLQFEGACGA